MSAKIKSGGFIGGHDYNHSGLPTVTKAVNEIFKKPVMVVDGVFDKLCPNSQLIGENAPSWLVRI